MPPGHHFDVIIAGAGPVGLFLACELGLAGVSVLVLERGASAASPWKAPGLGMRALNTVAIEAFYRRGLLNSLFDPRERSSTFQETSSFQYIESVLRKISGIDVSLESLLVASSFTDRAMQATSYRKGRVLLAGDSAHVHSPMGAQGLNTGIGDAINLGWKLAAVVHGSAPADLLDTYTQERHPVGAAVLEWSRAQVATLQPNPYGAALGKLIEGLLQTNDGTSAVVARIWGLSQRYDLGDVHPLVGMSAPDFELTDGTRLGLRLQSGRGLLVDFANEASLAKPGLRWAPQVDFASIRVRDTLGFSALLVRPDGVVAWVAQGPPELGAAAAALSRWFGVSAGDRDIGAGRKDPV